MPPVGHLHAAPSLPPSEPPPSARGSSSAPGHLAQQGFGGRGGSADAFRGRFPGHRMPGLPGLDAWVRDYACMGQREVDEFLLFNMRNLHSGQLYADDFYFQVRPAPSARPCEPPTPHKRAARALLCLPTGQQWRRGPGPFSSARHAPFCVVRPASHLWARRLSSGGYGVTAADMKSSPSAPRLADLWYGNGALGNALAWPHRLFGRR